MCSWQNSVTGWIYKMYQIMQCRSGSMESHNYYIYKMMGKKMKIFFICLISMIVAFTTCTGYAQELSGPGSEFIPDLEIIIKEANNIRQTKGDMLWKGWKDISVPIIVVNENYEFLFYDKDLTGDFNFYKLSEILSTNIYYRNRKMNKYAAACRDIIGTEFAVVMGTPSNLEITNEEWVITLLHESFHYLQNILTIEEQIKLKNELFGIDNPWNLKYPFPYDNEDVAEIFFDLGELLYNSFIDGLDKEDSLELASKLNELKSVLDKIDPKHFKYMMHETEREGLAFYTEFQLQNIIKKSYRVLPEFSELSGSKGFASIIQEEKLLSRYINPLKFCGNGVKGRMIFYFIGEGIALYMDKLYPDWKISYSHGKLFEEFEAVTKSEK